MEGEKPVTECSGMKRKQIEQAVWVKKTGGDYWVTPFSEEIMTSGMWMHNMEMTKNVLLYKL